jgi:hypothetical protein
LIVIEQADNILFAADTNKIRGSIFMQKIEGLFIPTETPASNH